MWISPAKKWTQKKFGLSQHGNIEYQSWGMSTSQNLGSYPYSPTTPTKSSELATQNEISKKKNTYWLVVQ
jgi:hypothetical protein